MSWTLIVDFTFAVIELSIIPRIEVLNNVMLYFDIFLQYTCTYLKE